MNEDRLTGILAILVTPFHDDLTFDEESHRTQVEFCIGAGARAVISTAVFGEFFTLSDSERIRIAEVTVDQAAGRLPVIATTSGVSTPHAVELTGAACDAGVDAVMAMPPYFAQLTADRVFEYFQSVAAASTVPVILQNAGDIIGAPVAPELLGRMFNEIERLEYLKEEVPPNPHSVTSSAHALGDSVKGIFGGHGGRYMITEHRRGATGWMPAPEFLELTVSISDLLGDDREEDARQLHARLVNALVWEQLYGVRWTKRVMMRRGIIRQDAVRMPSTRLDHEDDYELERILNDLADFLSVPGPFARRS